MAKDIGEGRWHKYGQAAVFDYCEEDVRKSVELLRRQLLGYRNYAPVNPHRVMEWSEYSAKTVAQVQAIGMPIDMPLWNLVQENKAAVIAALIARFDPQPGQRSIRFILPTASSPNGGSNTGSPSRKTRAAPVSDIGRGWIPARCSSTATPSG